jgi:putative ABC transport system ATP-binding protein
VADALTPLYEIRGLARRYRTGDETVAALDGVDLDLFAGELVVVVGPSGSGKSSLLNAIGGLDRPTAGRIVFRGSPITDVDETALAAYRRAHVGFVFQSYNLIPSLTASENVALGSVGVAGALDPMDALDRIGLRRLAGRFPAQMSGGEQQRVAVARAVAKRPAVLLCDEPTGALDRDSGVQVIEAIVDVQQQTGALAIVITHNIAIGGIAHRVLRLADGRIAETRVNRIRVRSADLTW